MRQKLTLFNNEHTFSYLSDCFPAHVTEIHTVHLLANIMSLYTEYRQVSRSAKQELYC